MFSYYILKKRDESQMEHHIPLYLLETYSSRDFPQFIQTWSSSSSSSLSPWWLDPPLLVVEQSPVQLAFLPLKLVCNNKLLFVDYGNLYDLDLDYGKLYDSS